MSELGMWPTQMQKTEQESENADDLAAPAESGVPALEADPTLAAEQPWNTATEEEWNEHSATSWALAYVIHRVRSTPHPPILLPEQRRHFEKIVEMAAALIAEWQGQERDLAQQLGTRRPLTELSTQPLDASQDQLDENKTDDAWVRPVFTPPYQLFLEEDDQARASSVEAPSHESGKTEASGPSATEDDYQI